MKKQEKGKLRLLLISMVLVFALVFFVGLGIDNNQDNLPLESTTQVGTQVQTAPEPEDDFVRLSFIGDCIFGDNTGEFSDASFAGMAARLDHSYFFSQVHYILSQDDLTIANFECVLSDRELNKTEKGYSPAFWFKANAKDADILKLGSVEVASVVNNHTYDYGEEGYKDTVAALEAQGIYASQELSPVYIDKKGIKIGILSCNLWADYQVSYIEDALETMQDKCDYKIVFFHGGEEGVHQPDNYKIDACRYLANSGLCDLIVGSHPHVLQPLEVVNDVPILYSLGNFCYSANTYPENKTIIFQADIRKTETGTKGAVSIIPCYVYTGSSNNYQPAVMTNQEDIDEVLRMMSVPVEHVVETEPTSSAVVEEETTQISP